MFKNYSQKGVSLYLAVIIMLILLAIALGVSTILVGQIKTIRGMGNSVSAFYAADTGIETELKKIFKDNDKQIKILLNIYFKIMLEIVFNNDVEISYPEKRNSIENRKKFFSKG